jgi:hypothetical protein
MNAPSGTSPSRVRARPGGVDRQRPVSDAVSRRRRLCSTATAAGLTRTVAGPSLGASTVARSPGRTQACSPRTAATAVSSSAPRDRRRRRRGLALDDHCAGGARARHQRDQAAQALADPDPAGRQHRGVAGHRRHQHQQVLDLGGAGHGRGAPGRRQLERRARVVAGHRGQAVDGRRRRRHPLAQPTVEQQQLDLVDRGAHVGGAVLAQPAHRAVELGRQPRQRADHVERAAIAERRPASAASRRGRRRRRVRRSCAVEPHAARERRLAEPPLARPASSAPPARCASVTSPAVNASGARCCSTRTPSARPLAMSGTPRYDGKLLLAEPRHQT